MLEMMICICILASISLLTLFNNKELNLEGYYFLNDYLSSQSKSFTEKQQYEIGHYVYFNHMGHVNQARTINFDNHKVIVHLGNGYATFE